MKRTILFTLGVSVLSSTVTAQDIIFKHDDKEIETKIEEMTDTEIKYREFAEPDGPVYVIPKSDVSKIKFENGEIMIFPTSGNNSGTDMEKPVYTIGDIYDENGLKGIVVHVGPDGHGLIATCIKDLKSKNNRWCRKKLIGQFFGADDENDGMKNMETIEKAIENYGLSWDDFPAFNHCRMLGEGWYLPSINETEYIALAINGGNLENPNEKLRESFNNKLKKITGTDKLSDMYELPPYNTKAKIMSSTEFEDRFLCYFHAEHQYFLFNPHIFVIPTDSVYIMRKYAEKKKWGSGHTGWQIYPVHKF